MTGRVAIQRVVRAGKSYCDIHDVVRGPAGVGMILAQDVALSGECVLVQFPYGVEFPRSYRSASS
jgi:hypothetical protein